jgi:hypothetical protein
LLETLESLVEKEFFTRICATGVQELVGVDPFTLEWQVSNSLKLLSAADLSRVGDGASRSMVSNFATSSCIQFAIHVDGHTTLQMGGVGDIATVAEEESTDSITEISLC